MLHDVAKNRIKSLDEQAESCVTAEGDARQIPGWIWEFSLQCGGCWEGAVCPWAVLIPALVFAEGSGAADGDSQGSPPEAAVQAEG